MEQKISTLTEAPRRRQWAHEFAEKIRIDITSILKELVTREEHQRFFEKYPSLVFLSYDEAGKAKARETERIKLVAENEKLKANLQEVIIIFREVARVDIE